MGSEDLSPIVIFTYNRPEHIKLLIQSLKENPLSKRSDLIIFSDGNKGEDDRKSVTAVRGILNKVAVSGGFRTIQIYESEYNRGLADSIIYGISAVMAKYDSYKYTVKLKENISRIDSITEEAITKHDAEIDRGISYGARVGVKESDNVFEVLAEARHCVSYLSQ